MNLVGHFYGEIFPLFHVLTLCCVTEVVAALEPTYVIMENVPGIVRDDLVVISEALRHLHLLGYQWRVGILNVRSQLGGGGGGKKLTSPSLSQVCIVWCCAASVSLADCWSSLCRASSGVAVPLTHGTSREDARRSAESEGGSGRRPCDSLRGRAPAVCDVA